MPPQRCVVNIKNVEINLQNTKSGHALLNPSYHISKQQKKHLETKEKYRHICVAFWLSHDAVLYGTLAVY